MSGSHVPKAEHEATRRLHAHLIERLNRAERERIPDISLPRHEFATLIQRLAMHMNDGAPVDDDDADLSTLLADVRRIANGVDGIQQLAIQLTGPRTPPAPMALTDRSREALDYIEKTIADSAKGSSSYAIVNTRDLSIVYELACSWRARQ